MPAPGAKALAELLASNRALQELVLSLNKVEDDGLGALVRALATVNSTLQYLDLAANGFSAAEIAQAIAAARLEVAAARREEGGEEDDVRDLE